MERKTLRGTLVDRNQSLSLFGQHREVLANDDANQEQPIMLYAGMPSPDVNPMAGTPNGTSLLILKCTSSDRNALFTTWLLEEIGLVPTGRS